MLHCVLFHYWSCECPGEIKLHQQQESLISFICVWFVELAGTYCTEHWSPAQHASDRKRDEIGLTDGSLA